MGLLTSNIARFRNDPRIFKLPPYLALLCMLGGVIWMCLLPLDQYHRRNYVSENALLPGQVHTYFSGSEQNIFRAYRHEVADILEATEQKDDQGVPTGTWLIATDEHRGNKIQDIFQKAGVKSARQKYKYQSAGKTYEGENIYGIVRGPRADGTESIVLVAPIRNIRDELNVNGVTLLLTLARYFSRWSLWSKDIILLITPDSKTGPQAWVDAYHSMHDSENVADLNLKSGHIQGALCIDYPFNWRFETLHIAYDGINGQLPNLDLINTVVSIASGQMGIGTSIQRQYEFAPFEDHGKYWTRLRTLFTGMSSQALGHATGAHSVFMPYHIDAITLTTIGSGWQDEMAFGRTVESTVRSLNNLLEKLHQSFFFYLLIQNIKFVSIGTYLPSAMAIGAGFTIIAIFSWIRGGYESFGKHEHTAGDRTDKPKQSATDPSLAIKEKATAVTEQYPAPSATLWKAMDRHLTAPVTYLAAIQLLSLLPVYFLTHLQAKYLTLVFVQSAVITLGAPVALALTLKTPTAQHPSGRDTAMVLKSQFFTILSSLSLLILGLDLTVLATLNFSLSMFLGLACAPLAFLGYEAPSTSSSSLTNARKAVSLFVTFLSSPPVVVAVLATLDTFYIKSRASRPDGLIATLHNYLENEAFAFNVWRAWGIMVGVWAVWVPAWIVGAMGVMASFGGPVTVSAEGMGTKKQSVAAVASVKKKG